MEGLKKVRIGRLVGCSSVHHYEMPLLVSGVPIVIPPYFTFYEVGEQLRHCLISPTLSELLTELIPQIRSIQKQRTFHD